MTARPSPFARPFRAALEIAAEPHLRLYATAIFAHWLLAEKVFTPGNSPACSRYALAWLCGGRREWFYFLPDALAAGWILWAVFSFRGDLAAKGAWGKLGWFGAAAAAWVAWRAASASGNVAWASPSWPPYWETGTWGWAWLGSALLAAVWAGLPSPAAGKAPENPAPAAEPAAQRLPVPEPAPVQDWRERAAQAARASLPGILAKVAEQDFPKANSAGQAFRLAGLAFTGPRTAFAELLLSPSAMPYVGQFNSHDWKLAIESRGSVAVPALVSANWTSSKGRNGIELKFEEPTIDLARTYPYPGLLDDPARPAAPLEFVLGKEARGSVPRFDLARAPHVLIAGSTGKGKSVGLTNVLVSLMRNRMAGEDIEFHIIDPKRVEFSQFKGLPGFDVITDMGAAAGFMGELVGEMERRYGLMESFKCKKISEMHGNGHAMPYKVVVVDEFGDIMTTGGDVGASFERNVILLAQKSRAAGIHLIIATQNPVAEVITSRIKANLPGVVGFGTVDGTKSRVILDSDALANLPIGRALVKLEPGAVLNAEEVGAEPEDRHMSFKTFYVPNEGPKETPSLARFIDLYRFKCIEAAVGRKAEGQSSIPCPEAGEEDVRAEVEALGIDYKVGGPAHRIVRRLVENGGYGSRVELRELFTKAGSTHAAADQALSAMKTAGITSYDQYAKRNNLVVSEGSGFAKTVAAAYAAVDAAISG